MVDYLHSIVPLSFPAPDLTLRLCVIDSLSPSLDPPPFPCRRIVFSVAVVFGGGGGEGAPPPRFVILACKLSIWNGFRQNERIEKAREKKYARVQTREIFISAFGKSRGAHFFKVSSSTFYRTVGLSLFSFFCCRIFK